MMTKRENMLSVLKREGGEWIPFTLSFAGRKYREFKERYRQGDREPMMGDFYQSDFSAVSMLPSRRKTDYSRFYAGRELRPGTVFNEEGVAREPAGFEHFTHCVSPLAGPDTTLKDIETYPLSDRDRAYRHRDFETQINGFHEQGLAVTAWAGNVFESSWQIRGMEDFLSDLYTAPELAEALVERLTLGNIAIAKAASKAGADIIRYGDDVATQSGMMMSPDLWRRVFKPSLARQFAAAKEVNPDVLTWYHSDGNCEAIVPDLIEIGLDILNPVQPECMDPAEMKKKYGDRLSFWGCVGTQTTLPFGTPEDVRATVRHLVKHVGYNGGLVIAPSHVIEPDVPWENIEAFADACREYGRLT